MNKELLIWAGESKDALEKTWEAMELLRLVSGHRISRWILLGEESLGATAEISDVVNRQSSETFVVDFQSSNTPNLLGLREMSIGIMIPRTTRSSLPTSSSMIRAQLPTYTILSPKGVHFACK